MSPERLERSSTSSIAEDLAAKDHDSLVVRLRGLGIGPAELEPDSHGTIGRTRTGHMESYVGTPEISGPGTSASEGLVRLGNVLGAGGMGVVREATQLGLRREVAVKQPLPGPDGKPRPSVVNALLREAWISSNLEHPNIVPIHALSREGTDPLIVMKRIEGNSWSALLGAEESTANGTPASPESLTTSERLRHHFRILLRVCRAVHFAHSRGIVHLDLKPSNVMIGAYGEVYLLDWGLGATFSEDAPEWMPRTSDIESVVGTPGYLSPEQSEGAGSKIGVASDVYLLGAIAHRIATGRAPHYARSLITSLLSSFNESPPVYADSAVPEDLAAILTRAMAKEPADRYPSADALRVALVEFIEHRASVDLTAEAMERLELIRGGDAPVDSLHSAILLGEVGAGRRAEAECRFGLVEALRIWPGNTAARESLDELARLVIADAVEEGDWRRAATALDWMEERDPTLQLKVDGLRDAGKAQRMELERLRALRGGEDLGMNSRVRAYTAMVVGFGWMVWLLALGAAHRTGFMPLTHTVLIGNVALTLLTFGVVNVMVSRTLRTTQVDRRVLTIMWCMFGGTGLLWIGAAIADLNPLQSLASASGFYQFFPMLVVLLVDRTILPIALVLIPVAVGAMAFWEYAFEWQAAYALIGGAMLGFRWLRSARALELAADSEAKAHPDAK